MISVCLEPKEIKAFNNLIRIISFSYKYKVQAIFSKNVVKTASLISFFQQKPN